MPGAHAAMLMVIDSIRDAAIAGREAPSNDALADTVGICRASVIRALGRAERLGLVRVARFQNSRIIAAADESWVTATPAHGVGWLHHTRRAA